MSDPCSFGWAASEVIKIIKVCDGFIKAYSDGPNGAASEFTQLLENVENFKRILEQLKDELNKQDAEVYIKWEAIKNTLDQCKTLSDRYSVYSQPISERGTGAKLVATGKYVWSGKKEVATLCGKLDRHCSYVMIYCHVLAMKSNRIQTSNLDHITTILTEQISQKLDLIHKDILEHPTTIHGRRSYSIGNIPTLNGGNPVAISATYEEDQKASANLQEYLERAKWLESQSKNNDEKSTLRQLRQDLLQLRSQVKYRIERNTSQGAQAALAGFELKPHAEKQRRRSGDSGYDSNCGTATSSRATESIAEDNFMISAAKISYSTGNGPREIFPCTLFKNQRDSLVRGIFPSPGATVPEHINLPRLLFGEHEKRPIPHVEWRGPTEKLNAPNRYGVIILGTPRVTPEVSSLEYTFKSWEESLAFQEIVFGQKLSAFCDAHKIRSSKRGKECDNVILRLWNHEASEKPKGQEYTLSYFANAEGRQDYVEINVHEIESLKKRDGQRKWELIFKKDTQSNTKLGQVTIEFPEDNQSDQKTLLNKLILLGLGNK